MKKFTLSICAAVIAAPLAFMSATADAAPLFKIKSGSTTTYYSSDHGGANVVWKCTVRNGKRALWQRTSKNLAWGKKQKKKYGSYSPSEARRYCSN